MATARRTTQARKPKECVYSVESAFGGRALVKAADIETVKSALDTARLSGTGATLVRADGEPIIVYPEFVFLIGEPTS
jgi:hypothetical protein